LAVGQVELTWVQHGTVGFEKILHTKTIYSLHKDNFVLWQLQRTNKGIGKPITLYHQELFKKRPSPDKFCT
jgi:hypothetical protein